MTNYHKQTAEHNQVLSIAASELTHLGLATGRLSWDADEDDPAHPMEFEAAILDILRVPVDV